jgi:ribulose-phosphate 3-epimerase
VENFFRHKFKNVFLFFAENVRLLVFSSAMQIGFYKLGAYLDYGPEKLVLRERRMEPEIIPAILVKERGELLRRISLVRDFVRKVQIDVMDGAFVPNKTVGIEDLKDLPEATYEFHWMVEDPISWIGQTPGNHMHLVHIETVSSFKDVKEAVKKAGGRLGLALNPETPLEKVLPFVPEIEEVLVMTVHPGFSGQKYLPEMEDKIRALRKLHPSLDIEVDGGIGPETIGRAYAAGANLLAAASAIFSSEDIEGNVENLKRCALSGCPA